MLLEASDLEALGQTLQAEHIYAELLQRVPGHVDAAGRLARLAVARGDLQGGLAVLRVALVHTPGQAGLVLDCASLHHALSEFSAATAMLEGLLTQQPGNFEAWLLLGQVRESSGDRSGALKARFQAVTRAQAGGHWLNEATTPAPILHTVVRAIECVRLGRRELLVGTLDGLKAVHGAAGLRRVEAAISGYLRESDCRPSDPRQRPKFLFFPGLPNAPFHDPHFHSWAKTLEGGFGAIRDEALKVLKEDRDLPNFISPAPGAPADEYVTGDGPSPSWEAFFFFRHGHRFDANHARCPQTSAVLESIELCRIVDHAPEVLFSVLKPGSHIKPHHGVSNIRLVMHLPLLVPNGCALNLVDRGEHHWSEGRLVMFDDTYLHEAWNRSAQTRVILLMDCWNPHLTEIERAGLTAFIETIGGLHKANRAARSAESLGKVGA